MSEILISKGFDRNNTIVQNPDKFKDFKMKLKGINIDINKSNRYTINEDIYDYIIKELNDLLIEFQMRLFETTSDEKYGAAHDLYGLSIQAFHPDRCIGILSLCRLDDPGYLSVY